MADFLFSYGLFLLKTLTVVAAVAAILLMAFGMSRRGHADDHHALTIRKLNDRHRAVANTLRRATLSRTQSRKEAKAESKREKAATKAAAKAHEERRRVFVLDFKGDIRATAVSSLREEVTAVLAVATPRDEVLIRLENFGGVVHEHGLAASQLQRIRDRGIPLTVAVDKGAASGGYLMACVANRILAAPFAVIGSIGVLAQIPNFHRLLDARGVDFEQITAGRYKRTVTMFGRTTDADRAKLREELEEVHDLFKRAVADQRSSVDVETIATGEHWYGTRALELGLVDEITASDDYLVKALEQADVLELSWRAKQTLQQRVLHSMRAGADTLANWASQRNHESRWH